MIRLLITFVAGLVLVVFPVFPALAAFDDSDMGFVEPATQDNLEYCEGDFEALCFGDYYKVLPSTSYIHKVVVPDTIVLHTDDQSGKTPERWVTSTTWNGLAGREDGGRSVHFGVGLDGITQFLPMYEKSVMQCRGAGSKYDSHSIQIEMAGRTYNYLITGEASPAMAESIVEITEKTVDLVASLMGVYGIPIENVIGHYHAKGSGKSDPGNLYFEEYFLPLLREKLNETSRQGQNIQLR